MRPAIPSSKTNSVAKIAERCSARCEQRKFCGVFLELRLEPTSGVEQRRGGEKFARLENGADAFDAIEPRVRIGEATEAEFAAAAEPFAGFANQSEMRIERGAIGCGSERVDVAMAGRTGSALAQEFAQLVEFEDVLGGA